MAKLEITINVIVHATEDQEKFFESFNEIFGLERDIFSISNVTGHFDNPISILRAKISKKPANQFLENFLSNLSEDQKKEMVEDIEKRIENSSLHLRLDKQEFIMGRITFSEKEAIKLKIQTPIYNKKETIKIFSEILQNSI